MNKKAQKPVVKPSSILAGLVLIFGSALLSFGFGGPSGRLLSSSTAYVFLGVWMIIGTDILIPPLLFYILLSPYILDNIPLSYIFQLPFERVGLRLLVMAAVFIVIGIWIYSSKMGTEVRKPLWFLPGAAVIAVAVFIYRLPLSHYFGQNPAEALRYLFYSTGPDIILGIALIVYCIRFSSGADAAESRAVKQVRSGKKVSAGREISAADDWSGSPGGNAFEPERPLSSGFEIEPDKKSLGKRGGRDLWDRK